MAKGVILDRDGTLIDFYRDVELGVVTPAFHPDHVVLLPGVVEGLCKLRDAGFVLAIATNQPDAALGRVSREAIAATNQTLLDRLAERGIDIAALEVCLHRPEAGPRGDASLVGPCDCRKPAPGMLERIIQRFALEPTRSWMLGDTRADAGAAQAAGVKLGLLLRAGRCELCPLVGGHGPFDAVELEGVKPDACAGRLDELADLVIALDQSLS